MKVMVTPVSEQTFTNLSVQVRKGAWSGLPAGNDGFRAGVSSWRTHKTCPLESGHCRLEGRSTHPNQSLCGQQTRTVATARSSLLSRTPGNYETMEHYVNARATRSRSRLQEVTQASHRRDAGRRPYRASADHLAARPCGRGSATPRPIDPARRS